MLRQSRSRPITPSRQSNNSIASNNSNNLANDAKKLEEKLAERRSSSSVTRSPIGLKPNHWSKELKEVTVVTQQDGVFNFRIVGGSDHGEFPVVVEVMPPDTRGVEYHSVEELTTQVQFKELYSALFFSLFNNKSLPNRFYFFFLIPNVKHALYPAAHLTQEETVKY